MRRRRQQGSEPSEPPQSEQSQGVRAVAGGRGGTARFSPFLNCPTVRPFRVTRPCSLHKSATRAQPSTGMTAGPCWGGGGRGAHLGDLDAGHGAVPHVRLPPPTLQAQCRCAGGGRWADESTGMVLQGRIEVEEVQRQRTHGRCYLLALDGANHLQ